MERGWRLVAAARAAAGLVLPTRCAGCGSSAAPWCPECAAAARRPAPGSVPGSPGTPPVWSGTVFEGPVRSAVTAWKDEGRSDLGEVLARLLAAALARALAEDEGLRAARARGHPVLVVPVPATAAARRRRGEDPVAVLATRATRLAGAGLVVVPALSHTRRVADQAGLGRVDRRRNVAGALTVRERSAAVVGGRPCVLCDDVVTTGATLGEAARALREAGARRVVAATAAATPRGP